MERLPARTPGAGPNDGWGIFDPRRSLRARALLWIGGGMAAFTLIVGSLTGTIYRRTLESSTGAAFEALAFQVSDKLDRALYERQHILVLASDLDALRHENTTPAMRRRVLEQVQNAAPDFGWIGFADTSGRIVAGTNGLFEGTEIRLRPWFNGAREYPYVGGLREIPELTRSLPAADDGQSQSRFLDLSVPVVNKDGLFAGVLVAHVRWTWTRSVQLSVVPEPAGRDHIGVTVYAADGDVLIDSGASGWSQPPEQPAVGSVGRFRGYLVESTSLGSTYLTGFARSRGFRDYRGASWLAVVRQPFDRVFATAASLQRSINLWGLLLSAIGGGVAWIVAGQHARRLRSMGLAARRIRNGDVLAVLPRPRGESELDAMCGSLGELVEDLRSQHELLNAENTRLAAQAHARDRAAAKR